MAKLWRVIQQLEDTPVDDWRVLSCGASGNDVTFTNSAGWRFEVFVDAGSLDYIDHASSLPPEGGWEYDYEHLGPHDRLMPECWEALARAHPDWSWT